MKYYTENDFTRLENKRKLFITYLNKYNQLIKEEMCQFSLDKNTTHLDEVYFILFECYMTTIRDFKSQILK